MTSTQAHEVSTEARAGGDTVEAEQERVIGWVAEMTAGECLKFCVRVGGFS
ncbi:MAG: hypothetical protein KJO57_01375 [Deltaproteobacteria bacterium]|nr:hypothetical protein [Deltaproteobacteria bacterium]